MEILLWIWRRMFALGKWAALMFDVKKKSTFSQSLELITLELEKCNESSELVYSKSATLSFFLTTMKPQLFQIQ